MGEWRQVGAERAIPLFPVVTVQGRIAWLRPVYKRRLRSWLWPTRRDEVQWWDDCPPTSATGEGE